jgi:hypothetical protein
LAKAATVQVIAGSLRKYGVMVWRPREMRRLVPRPPGPGSNGGIPDGKADAGTRT